MSILKQILHSRINCHCEENNILNENQGGFRKNCSTISTVALYTNKLFNAINKKNISIATYIDFSKAFDTVDHHILLLKLGKIGIKGNTLSGVPQGSFLGPLLFLLYINDLCEVIEKCSTFPYANDTVLVTSEPDIYTAHMNLQNDLNNVANWCKGNKWSINIKETKSMVIGTRSMVKRRPVIPQLKIDNQTMDFVFQYKYLGIIINETLSLQNHLKNTIKIVSHKIFLLHKIRTYITKVQRFKCINQ